MKKGHFKRREIVSSFFTHTSQCDGNLTNEIDIEFLGKDTRKVQFTFYTDNIKQNEYLYDLGFDASLEFHTYGFEWLESSITWVADGKPVYKVTEGEVIGNKTDIQKKNKIFHSYL